MTHSMLRLQPLDHLRVLHLAKAFQQAEPVLNRLAVLLLNRRKIRRRAFQFWQLFGGLALSMGIPFRKHLLDGERRIKCGGKSSIDRHLNDDLNNFLPTAADIQRAMNVHFQLRLGMADRSQRRHRGNFPIPQRKSTARINVAETELDRVPRQIGRDRLKCLDHALAGFAVDFLQFFPASLKTFVGFFCHGVIGAAMHAPLMPWRAAKRNLPPSVIRARDHPEGISSIRPANQVIRESLKVYSVSISELRAFPVPA